MACSFLNFSLFLGVCAVSTSEAQIPDTANAGTTTQAEVSVDPPSTVLMERVGDGNVILHWPLNSGATGYRILRGIAVDHDLDSLGRIVEVNPPSLKWIPWAKVDLVLDSLKTEAQLSEGEGPFPVAQGGVVSIDSFGVRLLLAALSGNTPEPWGVSTSTVVGGVTYNSKVRRADTKIRGGLLCWWDLDMNGDSRTDYADFFLLMDTFDIDELEYQWNPTCDLSGDHTVNMDDIFIFVDWWDLLQRLPHNPAECGNPEKGFFNIRIGMEYRKKMNASGVSRLGIDGRAGVSYRF